MDLTKSLSNAVISSRSDCTFFNFSLASALTDLTASRSFNNSFNSSFLDAFIDNIVLALFKLVKDAFAVTFFSRTDKNSSKSFIPFIISFILSIINDGSDELTFANKSSGK